MAQNINLLTEIAIRPVSPLNSRLIVKISAGWILVLVIVYLINLVVYTNTKQLLTGLENQKAVLQSQVDNCQKELSRLLGGETLLNLQGLPIGSNNTRGFYNHLKDLAAFIPHAVWLTNINISEIDGSIVIEGGTVASSGVPALIDALNKAPNFDNKKFNTILIDKKPDSVDINFILSTDNTSDSTKNKATNKT